MGRQGRLHSSPFHVETIQYQYAIEHENQDCYRRKEIPECEFIGASKVLCGKWNSGEKKCAAHRCAFYNHDKRRKASCESCALYVQKECYHSRSPRKTNIDPQEAQYCAFFIAPGDERYDKIRRICARYNLTQRVKECRERIKSKNKYITNAQVEYAKPQTTEEIKKYLIEKIERKKIERQQAEKQLKIYSQKLVEQGGKIDCLPWDRSKKK